MAQGFKSLTKARRKQISTAAGIKSQKMGVAHSFDKIEASKAAAKSVATRKRKAALAAAKRLITAGFTSAQLHDLGLSFDEYIYYGGADSNGKRMIELAERVVELTDMKGSDNG